jgi:hypothetical protein
MKFGEVVAFVDEIHQHKFQLKIRKGMGSIGVQVFGPIASPADKKHQYLRF